ncbi:hypothetical protein OIM90_01720 [Streptomyces sp. AD16]|nr:hypothetical protein OIM90_01720 [Streptomyces sp. AD16]
MRSTETERMLRLRDVARLPAEVLVKRFEEDFGNLVTAAVADATRRLPAPVRRLLDGLEWHLDWADALVWAEGELQVSAERMTLLGDPRLRRVEGQLRQVRVRLHEARCVAADYRRQDRERLEQGRLLTARATALSWLSKAFPEEYAALFAARVAELGIPPLRRHIASRDVFDSIEQAVAQDRLQVTAGPEVTALLELPDDTFRAAVADDVREQNARNVLLRHPWSCAAGTRGSPVSASSRSAPPAPPRPPRWAGSPSTSLNCPARRRCRSSTPGGSSVPSSSAASTATGPSAP